MPAPMPTSAVRPPPGRASPTARAPSPRRQREATPKTTRNGVALNGRSPANPAARIAVATRSSGRRNRCARSASRTPPGVAPRPDGSMERGDYHTAGRRTNAHGLRRELGREDSNLQLPISRGRRAQRRPKQDKNLSDPSNVKQAPAKQKIDPETVTKPSSASAPRRRI